jgi:hypothetical protein
LTGREVGILLCSYAADNVVQQGHGGSVIIIAFGKPDFTDFQEFITQRIGVTFM